MRKNVQYSMDFASQQVKIVDEMLVSVSTTVYIQIFWTLKLEEFFQNVPLLHRISRMVRALQHLSAICAPIIEHYC